ncbi:MAG: hypothetical protein J5542_06490 [Bacteroidales bacterium]|nr:hypothetical protein [Bacteroidales bacterium]
MECDLDMAEAIMYSVVGRSLRRTKKKLFMVVKTAFNQRRKTLRNSLKSMLSPETDMSHRFWNLRPEQLSPEEFVELTGMIK